MCRVWDREMQTGCSLSDKTWSAINGNVDMVKKKIQKGGNAWSHSILVKGCFSVLCPLMGQTVVGHLVDESTGGSHLTKYG